MMAGKRFVDEARQLAAEEKYAEALQSARRALQIDQSDQDAIDLAQSLVKQIALNGGKLYSFEKHSVPDMIRLATGADETSRNQRLEASRSIQSIAVSEDDPRRQQLTDNAVLLLTNLLQSNSAGKQSIAESAEKHLWHSVGALAHRGLILELPELSTEEWHLAIERNPQFASEIFLSLYSALRAATNKADDGSSSLVDLVVELMLNWPFDDQLSSINSLDDSAGKLIRMASIDILLGRILEQPADKDLSNPIFAAVGHAVITNSRILSGLLLATRTERQNSRPSDMLTIAMSRLWQAVCCVPKDKQQKRKDDFHKMLCSAVLDKMLDSTRDTDRIFGMQVLATALQIDSEGLGCPLFMRDNLLQTLLIGGGDGGSSEDDGALMEFESPAVRLALVELFSAACADKTCRMAIANSVAAKSFLGAQLRQKITAFNEKDGKSAMDCTLANAAALVYAKLNDQQVTAGSEARPERQKQQQQQQDLIYRFRSTLLDGSQISEVAIQDAIEGLAYETTGKHRRSIKDWLAGDEKLLKRLCSLCEGKDKTVAVKSGNSSNTCNLSLPIALGVAVTMQNLVSLPKILTEEEEQLQRLKAFAERQSRDAFAIDESLEDDEAVIKQRAVNLVNAGAVPALCRIAAASSDRPNILQAVANALLGCAMEPQNRGRIVAQGSVVRTLLNIGQPVLKQFWEKPPCGQIADNPLALSAFQTLAKLAISLDPSIAFRSTATEMIRPLIYLACSENQLHQFESLLALTNLSSMPSETVVSKINSSGGIRVIESLQFSENQRVQCAATETICNLISYPPVRDLYIANNDVAASRLRLLVALCDADREDCRLAASGALAILSGESEQACLSILKLPHALTNLCQLLASGNESFQHRAVECLKNLAIAGNKEDRLAISKAIDAKFGDNAQQLCVHRNPAISQTARQLYMKLQ